MGCVDGALDSVCVRRAPAPPGRWVQPSHSRALHIPALLLEEGAEPPPVNRQKGNALPGIVFRTVIFSEHYVDMKKRASFSTEFLGLL